METVNYWSKSVPVKAVRLTSSNIKDVAEAVGGEWEAVGSYDGYRALVVGGVAFPVGDWVVEIENNRYQFYTHEEFVSKYRTIAEEMAADEKFAKVFGLVMGAMRKQDAATYHGDSNNGMDLVAAEVTKKILGEL